MYTKEEKERREREEEKREKKEKKNNGGGCQWYPFLGADVLTKKKMMKGMDDTPSWGHMGIKKEREEMMK